MGQDTADMNSEIGNIVRKLIIGLVRISPVILRVGGGGGGGSKVFD